MICVHRKGLDAPAVIIVFILIAFLLLVHPAALAGQTSMLINSLRFVTSSKDGGGETSHRVYAQSRSTEAARSSVPDLRAGIEQYQKGNFEEAIDILTQVRKKDPSSSTAAFFLGMAYKAAMDFPNTAMHLEAAVTLLPHIREAVVHLVDAFYRIEKLPEAKKWIEVAEKEGISLPDITYLKGLILAKENQNHRAVEAFEKAKSLDTALAQSADFQIALCFIRERQLEKARERLQIVVRHDPSSDLAAFARQYQDLVEKGLYLERPLRLTVGFTGGYDSNVIAKPLDAAVAGNITDEGAAVFNSTVRIDYVPRMTGSWLFNASYTFNSKLHSRFSTTHDNMANSIFLAPGYNFGRSAVNIVAGYTNALMRTDPDLFPAADSSPGYRRYMDYWTAGPTFRFLATQNHIVEVFGGYDVKQYYNQKPTSQEGRRDSAGPRAYLSWMLFFKQDAFVNLRYDFNTDHTDGTWWENDTHRFTFNAIFPLLSEVAAERTGQVALQLSGAVLIQEYKNQQPFLDRDGFIKMARRQDKTYTGSIGLTWEFSKHASLLAQYTYAMNDSNMPMNEYNRNLYTGGIEFRF